MKLNELMNAVTDTKILDNCQDSETLCRLLAHNVTLHTVREWIKELQMNASDKEIANLASLMEVHPLGFEKYVLWDNPMNGTRARLHYWPQKDWPFESIHDHRFNFCSVVVKGHYIHEEYLVKENQNSNKVEVELTNTNIVNQGHAYFFQAGTFHRVLQSNEETISFLVRSEPKLPFSRVINPDTLEMRKAYGAINKFKSKLESLEQAL